MIAARIADEAVVMDCRGIECFRLDKVPAFVSPRLLSGTLFFHFFLPCFVPDASKVTGMTVSEDIIWFMNFTFD